LQDATAAAAQKRARAIISNLFMEFFVPLDPSCTISI